MSVIERNDAGSASAEEPVHDVAPHGPHPSRRGVVAVAMVALVALLGAVFAATRDDDGGPGSGASTTIAPTSIVPSTTAPTTTAPTTTAPTTTSPPTTVPVDSATAVFPSGSGVTGFTDPVAAARAFAVDFVGFVDPVVGEFQEGDSQSGEVEVRPSASGPVTTVMVRRFGDSWWVLGSATGDIQVHEPAALAAISSPVRLRGVSTAFEANVGVEIRQDGARRPLGDGYVMGGSMGDFGPFDGTVTFADPGASMGAVVFYTVSMENGNIWEASVVRVRFTGSASLLPTSACPDYSMARPDPAAGQMVVKVFYTCDVDAPAVPTYRLSPAAPGVLRAALESLLAGPTAAEANAGLESWFSPATASMLDNVVIRDGMAIIDFHDLRQVIPNASTSAGSGILLRQLDATVFQFSAVSTAIYRINGDCEAFSEWLQFGGCEPRTRVR